MSDPTHQHHYTYAGVRYAHGAYNLPGSGAKARYYAHVYFCESCLDTRYEAITGIEESSYAKLQFNATPGDPKALVPEHDRERYR